MSNIHYEDSGLKRGLALQLLGELNIVCFFVHAIIWQLLDTHVRSIGLDFLWGWYWRSSLMDFARSVASTVVELASKSNGAGETTEASLQICPESLQRGYTPVPNFFLPLNEFNNTCSWLEGHCLIGYFLGRIPNESTLKGWIQQAQTPSEMKVNCVQNLSKSFFLFQFKEPEQAKEVFTRGSWYVRNAFLVSKDDLNIFLLMMMLL